MPPFVDRRGSSRWHHGPRDEIAGEAFEMRAEGVLEAVGGGVDGGFGEGADDGHEDVA